jgi:hypothetical protein
MTTEGEDEDEGDEGLARRSRPLPMAALRLPPPPRPTAGVLSRPPLLYMAAVWATRHAFHKRGGRRKKRLKKELSLSLCCSLPLRKKERKRGAREMVELFHGKEKKQKEKKKKVFVV